MTPNLKKALEYKTTADMKITTKREMAPYQRKREKVERERILF